MEHQLGATLCIGGVRIFNINMYKTGIWITLNSVGGLDTGQYLICYKCEIIDRRAGIYILLSIVKGRTRKIER